MRVSILIGLVALIPAAAQTITIAVTPQPMAVVNAIPGLKVREIGMWTVYIRNSGPLVRTLTSEDIYIAILQIRPIDPANVQLVLSGKQQRSTAAKIVRGLTIIGAGTGIALGFLSKSNVGWATGLAVGSAAIPQIIQIATGEVPNPAPLIISLLNAPITLAPSQAATRTVFAAKQPNPQPLTVLMN